MSRLRPHSILCLLLHKEASLTRALPAESFYSAAKEGPGVQKQALQPLSVEISDLLAKGLLGTSITYYFFAWLHWCVLHQALQRLHGSFKGRSSGLKHLLEKKNKIKKKKEALKRELLSLIHI